MDLPASALLGGVDDAGVERTRIDVQTDGSLIKFAGIEDAMDRLPRVDGARMRGIHLQRLG